MKRKLFYSQIRLFSNSDKKLVQRNKFCFLFPFKKNKKKQDKKIIYIKCKEQKEQKLLFQYIECTTFKASLRWFSLHRINGYKVCCLFVFWGTKLRRELLLWIHFDQNEPNEPVLIVLLLVCCHVNKTPPNDISINW